MNMPFESKVVAYNRSSRSSSPLRVTVLLLAAMLMLNGLFTIDATASDERLVELLSENLAIAGIDDSALSFTETDGVVTLVGRLENADVKVKLIDVIERTHGVLEIVDKFTTDF